MRRLTSAPPHLVGLVGIVLAFLSIGVLFAVSQPSFYDADESAHLSYAYEVAHFRLPEVTTRVEPPRWASEWHTEWAARRDNRYRSVWVANHPPLNYIASAPAMWAADIVKPADGGLMLLRMQNLSFAAVGVVLTYALAVDLSNGNRRLGLLSAAAVSLVGQGHVYFSRGLNDGLAFAAATGLVWATVRCLRAPENRRALWVLSAFAVIGAGTRAATMLLALGLVAVVTGHQLLRRSEEPPVPARRRRIRELSWRRATGAGLIGLAPATLLWQWFYARNYALYGDIGGSAFLLDRFDREPIGTTLGVLSYGDDWLGILKRGLTVGPIDWDSPRFASVFAAFAVCGLILVLARRRSGWWRPGLIVGMIACSGVTITVAQHIAGGGTKYARYFFPVLGVIAILVIAAFDELLPRIGPLILVAVMAWWLGTHLPLDIQPELLRRTRYGTRPTPPLLNLIPAGDGMRTTIAVIAGLAGVLAVYGMTMLSLRPAVAGASSGEDGIRSRT